MSTTDLTQMYQWFHYTSELLEGSSIPGPPSDHSGKKDTFYMMASDYTGADSKPADATTTLLSPNLIGSEHPVECFGFWFYFGVG